MKSHKVKEINRFFKDLGCKYRKKYIPDRYKDLDIRSADTSYAVEVINYYREIGCKNFTPLLHLLLDERINVKSKYFLPDELRETVMRVLNGHDRNKYIDKNMYPLIVNTTRQPRNIIRSVNGGFFDEKNHSLNLKDAFRILDPDVEYIVKPSLTYGGSNIGICKRQNESMLFNGTSCSFENFAKRYGDDFIIQEKIVQSDITGQIHPESLNTLRLVTLRWHNEIHYLTGFLRTGSGSSVNDNATTGGTSVGVNDNGILNNYAVDITGKVLFTHPTSGFDFKKNAVRIPNFERFKEFVINLHTDILHHNLVSWDIAVGADHLPVFIEHNFAGQFWIYQFAAGKPLFRDFSDEILRYIVRKDQFITLNPSLKLKRIGPLANDEFIMRAKRTLAALLRKLRIRI